MAARLTTYLVVGIVAATLIAGLIVGAQRDDSEGPVDLIVHNAKVHTAGGSGAVAEAVAIRGNQILRVGSNREINRLRRPQTTVIDAERGAVLPGFNDSHVHFIDGGLTLAGVDLADARSADEIQARVRAWAEANPDRAWVVGQGWHLDAFAETPPNRLLLDAAVADRPARLMSADGRTAWLNTEALRVAKITRRTADPSDGVIAREGRSKEPNGLLIDRAVALVDRVVPAARRDDRVRALHAAIAEAHRFGITSIQDLGVTRDDFDLYDELRRDGGLDLRVYASPALGGGDPQSRIDALDSLLKRFPDDPLIKTGAVTIALDGAIASHTAAMLEPYDDKPVSGEPALDPDTLNRLVRLLDARGWQVTIDAAGDRAIRMSLDAFEHAVRSNPAPAHGRRHRIEHAAIADPLDIPRFKPLGTLASMQPFFAMPDSTENAPAWVRTLGAERAIHAWAVQTLAAAGVRLAFGSDWPSAPLNPLLGLQAAVTRNAPADGSDEPLPSPERLGLKTAVEAYTAGAAFASFDEQRKGSIKPGMLADLVILSSDIFAARAGEIAAADVALTIFDGRIVYRHPRKTVP
jgi:predicted amidohydrolase YtcJ